jgi:hypothetical protein
VKSLTNTRRAREGSLDPPGVFGFSGIYIVSPEFIPDCGREWVISPRGQTETHFPQSVHFSGSIAARLPSIVIAPLGHSFLHMEQPTQPAPHTRRTAAPRSCEEHLMMTSLLYEKGVIIFRGQASTHTKQPVHFSWSTTALPSLR